MWNLKHDTEELTYETDSMTWRRDLWLSRGRRLGKRRMESWGLARQLLSIGWIDNKVKQYIPGNYLQYSVETYIGKESEKE